jgi:hypothetical protein
MTNDKDAITNLVCPFCGNRYIIKAYARFLERYEDSSITSEGGHLNLVIECPCGATYSGGLDV